MYLIFGQQLIDVYIDDCVIFKRSLTTSIYMNVFDK